MIGDLFDSPWKILIVAVVLIVLFGSAKLPVAARSLGKSMRILKSEVKDLHVDEPEAGTAPPVPMAPAQLRIDDLHRQLAELKEPVAGQPAGQPAAPRTGQPG
jgi:sec-independent protein translocase protein TatA